MMSRTDGWTPNIVPEFSLAKYEEVIEMLDYIRTYGPGNPLASAMANQIIDQYRHLVHELGMLQYELENARKANAKLQAELDKCREALKQVEWMPFPLPPFRRRCLWCGGMMDDGHKPDCPRQAALESSHE